MTQQPHFSLYINGEFRQGSSKQVMETSNPANGGRWATFDCADELDVELAVSGARRALTSPEWAGLTATQRGKLMFKLADLIQKNVKIQLMIMLRVTRIQTQRIRVQSKAMSILRIHL